MYVCSNPQCHRKIKALEKSVRCPSCGCRVLYKERQPIAKEVSTD